MGRLFWKFFCFTLIAQLIATIGIASTFWLMNRNINEKIAEIDMSPPAAFAIDAAALALQYGGTAALNQLIENADRRHQIYAIDDDGKEFLDRKFNPSILAQARKLLKQESEQEGRRNVVREAKAPDGRRYILFSPALGRLRPDGSPEFVYADAFAGAYAGKPPPGPAQPGDRPLPPRNPPPRIPHFLPLVSIVTSLLASLIFALTLAWYFSKPIRSLRSAFDAAANGNLDAQLGSTMGGRHDELSDLGRDFDRMANQLRTLMDGQRKLLHDVSHELRSPLARIQAAIGLARQDHGKTEASMVRIERESVRMDKLVGELLTLSRLEGGVMQALEEDINMEHLVLEIVEDARFEAESHHCEIDFVGNCAVTVRGAGELLRRAIENVVRNAVKHGGEGARTAVQAAYHAQRKELALSILDSGPGVPEAELAAIFEPFFRGNGARNHTDGHGLGLAIAKRIVEAQRGRIAAFNREGGGLCVEITLPVLHA